MTTAEHLDTIDRLLTTAFPTGPEGGPGHGGGPGHLLVTLSTTRDFRFDDGSGREEAAEQIDAECEALVQALTGRWGEPQVFTVGSLRERGFAGEEMPEPWGEIGNTTDHVNLWRAGERWLVVYVAQWDVEFPYLLTAASTVTDPP